MQHQMRWAVSLLFLGSLGCAGGPPAVPPADGATPRDAGVAQEDAASIVPSADAAAPAADAGQTPGVDGGPLPERDGGLPPSIASEWGSLESPREHCAARSVASGPTTFVSPSGTDATGCGAETSPCATLQYAYDALPRGAGATVYLRAGVYTRGFTTNPRRAGGTSGADPVHITSYPGEWAVFQVGGDRPFVIDATPFLRFSCFEIDGFGGSGVHIYDASDIEVDHLEIHGVRSNDGGINPSGIKTNSGTTRLHLHHNDIWDVYQRPGGVGAPHNFHGIVVFDSTGGVGSGDIEVDHNLVWNCGSGIRQKHGGAGPHPINRFHHNIVFGRNWGIAGGAEYSEHDHNIVLGGGSGIVPNNDGFARGGHYHHNTIVAGTGVWMPSPDEALQGTTARVNNNVFASSTGHLWRTGNTSVASVDFNLYTTETFRWTEPGNPDPFTSLAQWQSVTGLDANSQRGDAWFAAPSSPLSRAEAVTLVTPQRTASAYSFLCETATGAGEIGAVPCAP